MQFSPPNGSGRILLYRDSPNYTGQDIIFVADEDIEIAQLDLSQKSAFKCFSASVSNLKQYGDVLRIYAHYKYNLPIAAESPFHDMTCNTFFWSWEGLVDGFNALTPRTIFSQLAKARSVSMPFLGKANTILSLVESFTNCVILPLLEGSPYCDRDPQAKPRRWTPIGVNWLQAARNLLQVLKNIKNNNPGISMPTVDKLQLYISEFIKGWDAFEKKDETEKCFLMGAYTYGIAKMHCRRENLSFALLLLHRALDFYLQFLALGLGHSLMAHTAGGIKYTGVDTDLPINPLKTFKKLENTGQFTGLPFYKPTIENINEARNLLLLTHYVYRIEKADILECFKKFDEMVVAIDGNKRFLHENLSWLNVPRIERSFIFELEGSVDTYLAEI